MTTAELLEAYRQTAIRHATAMRAGKYKVVNKAYDEGVILARQLRHGSPEMQQALLMLLDDMEPAVRLWAALDALELEPDKGLRVLHTLAAGPPSPVRLSAETALQQWEEGKLLPLP